MRNGLLSEIKEYIKEPKIPGINQSPYDVRKENGKKNRIKNANFHTKNI
ncbi:hypothetical protein [Caloranaerobacter sp. DY30410]